MSNKYTVYIIECNDHTLYTGYTNHLENRLKQHTLGKGAKYTRGRAPFKLRYQRHFSTKSEALKEEYKIKRLTRKQKESYILKGGDKGVYAEEL